MIRCRTRELKAFRLGHASRLAAWGIDQGSDTEARRAVDEGLVGICEKVRSEQEQEEDRLIYLRSEDTIVDASSGSDPITTTYHDHSHLFNCVLNGTAM